MERIKTLTTKTLNNTVKTGGCGECQTSCQSACKTSCTVGNQHCENDKQFLVFERIKGCNIEQGFPYSIVRLMFIFI